MGNLNKKLPSRVGVDIVIGDHQQKQENAQHVRENSQLYVGDHSEILN